MNEKVVLITGSARRIGAAIACHFHEAGYSVAVHYHRSESEATHLVAAFNASKANSAIAVWGDLSQTETTDNLIRHVLQWRGRLDVLINNASVFSRQATDWDTLFAVNVKAPFALSQAAFASLSQTGGCIVNITDIHATMPLKGYSVYCQSKAALWMQTKSLAREFAPSVRVNAVAPGAMAWPEGENTLTTAEQAHIIAKTPLRRHGEVQFVAQAVFDLVGQPFTTGQSLAVDGGRLLFHGFVM